MIWTSPLTCDWSEDWEALLLYAVPGESKDPRVWAVEPSCGE